VLVAGNGREALELLHAEDRPIDLLLTDVIMPELNGQDLAERVRAERPEIRVIFMSGYNEEAVLRHGVLALGTSFVEKPFSPAELLERVRTTLDAPPPSETVSES
jgi:two-component system, cell cycle sensor histidine kinase and response regulator CckA